MPETQSHYIAAQTNIKHNGNLRRSICFSTEKHKYVMTQALAIVKLNIGDEDYLERWEPCTIEEFAEEFGKLHDLDEIQATDAANELRLFFDRFAELTFDYYYAYVLDSFSGRYKLSRIIYENAKIAMESHPKLPVLRITKEQAQSLLNLPSNRAIVFVRKTGEITNL